MEPLPSQKTQSKVHRGPGRNSHAWSRCCCKAAVVSKRVLKTVEAINSVHGTSFSAPLSFSTSLSCDEAFSQAKKFFSGLLDSLNGTGSHPWLPLVIGLPVKERLKIASSLVSGKKLLPDPCPRFAGRMAEAHASLMSQPKEAPEEFLVFVRQQVKRMFPRGWDKGYSRCIEGTTLPLSAGIGLPRSRGGVSACGMARAEYARACSGDVLEGFPVDVRFQVVIADGKARGITVTHKEHQFLKPLHTVLYDFLSRKNWMLRGDATAKKLAEFVDVAGEKIVSGDYESATDGLSLEVSEAILDTLLSTATHTPESIKRWALMSLRNVISYPGDVVVEQMRGQLMGNLLSFPLLCI